MNRVTLMSDGGSRGNPGPAGIGFVIEADSEVICRGGRFLGECTNNVAEYEALIWGLENVLALGHTAVLVLADSELLIKQINGAYRVKNEGLKPLFVRVLTLRRRFESFEARHIPREKNKQADALANEAMDLRGPVGDYACEPGAELGPGALF